MTREEAIKVLKENYDYHVNYDSGDYEWGDDLAKAVKMAIQDLEQEPMSVIEDVKEEIKQIVVSGQVDEHISFIRTGEQVKTMVLDIIDKHCGKENIDG